VLCTSDGFVDLLATNILGALHLALLKGAEHHNICSQND